MEKEKKIDWTAWIEKLSKELAAKTRELITLLRGEGPAAKTSKSPATFAPRGETAPLILRCLLGHSVPLRPSDIEEDIDVVASTISTMLTNLHRHGMVERRENGWQLTAAGRAWIEKHNPGIPKVA